MAGSFGAVTNTLIGDAKFKMKQGKELTMHEKVLLKMSDGKWHHGAELADVSWRFGGYLHILKQRGVKWEKQPIKGTKKSAKLFEYRLIKGD